MRFWPRLLEGLAHAARQNPHRLLSSQDLLWPSDLMEELPVDKIGQVETEGGFAQGILDVVAASWLMWRILSNIVTTDLCLEPVVNQVPC
jgi:hypothetical protein